MTMPTVRYDDRSYSVDDRRIWLTSGSIHYFRIPAELWRDRLLKAKRAGLNCVQTYAAWNVHESVEGRWDFEGDADVAAFVELAGELGMYVILRPGPYICAEWDFGGLPAWLAAKSGISYRTTNATYMHYFDKYLGQLLPRLAEMQVTRGGNIILIQNENEYYYTTMPDRQNYCEFINQLFRRSGFEIPIITCNMLTEPLVPDTVECVNTWNRGVQELKRLRELQGGAPMLVTEFWAGWFDYWGRPHQTKDPAETARRALEILGCGSQFNYYMWHGGTNFAFWGSRLSANEAAYQTTSYDYDAPLAEGGGITEKYHLTKLVNMLSTHFGQVFAQARMERPGVTVHDGTQAFNLTGPNGRMAVISNNGREDITSAAVSLPNGKDMEVSLEPIGAVAVPVDVRLGAETVLDYANLMPLGIFGERNLLLHGPAGWEGRISINGQEIRHRVPAGETAELIEHCGRKIVLLNTGLARRTWELDGALLIGPAFVGETADDITPAPGTTQYQLLSPEGELTQRKLKPSPTRKPTAPRLGAFTRIRVCEEPMGTDLEWHKLDRPKDMAALGISHGYGWYRLAVDSSKAVRRYLFLPECEDRAQVYVNRQWAGTWGRGTDAAREPMSVPFKRGPNDLVFLVDNLGRDNFGAKLGQPKGLCGHIWDARPLRLKKFKLTSGAEFARRMVPRIMSHMIPQFQAGPLWTAEVVIPLPKIHPVHLSYTNLPHDLILLCNGRQAGFYPNSGGYGQVTLANELKKGSNKLTLLLRGEVEPKSLENVKAHALLECISGEGKWSYRQWEVPVGEGRVVGKDLPAWYRARFKYSQTSVPLFLKINGAKKGQVYLNGHNVGRFWNIGPQQLYYLPEPWLAAENELLIFDEQGRIPSGSRLAFLPAGPYHQ